MSVARNLESAITQIDDFYLSRRLQVSFCIIAEITGPSGILRVC
jgi:hypothetical protein